METKSASDVYWKLEQEFQSQALERPMRLERYEAGTELEYEVTGIEHANTANVRLKIDKFVGGGFAGQVYRVKLLDISNGAEDIGDLRAGGEYAMKILIPPSRFAQLFRNSLYWIGFQGPFQLQVNPTAARAGALWQKFIRRGTKLKFDDETSVVDIHATFVDANLGSCGELSEWLNGRTWRLEVDDHLDLLKRWIKGKAVDYERLGSPEYRAKYVFMRQFVALLHEMGAHEFARQYEWSTWKSQPNCLKRNNSDDTPSNGLTAVDFRAGLALLPFLPMSPGDFKLILSGIARGSLVQFDRGNIKTLEQYINAHKDEFGDMQHMLKELRSAEHIYRNSIPDITHNHVRLLYSHSLWSTMLKSAVIGWRVRNLIDQRCQQKMQTSSVLTLLFLVLGFIPFLGRIIRRIWAQPLWRTHYRKILTNYDYFRRSVRAKCIEKLITWHRFERLSDQHALTVTTQPWRCIYHWPLSLLPEGIHRFVTDWQFAKDRLDYYLLRPVRLYFNNELREQWLMDMVTEGKDKHLLSDEDASVILSQIKEPYIQKYLKSLAVHVCTLPVTQVVSVVIAILYVLTHPELPRTQAYAIGVGIIALFQVVPISPGSLVRGLYVLYLVIKERNFRDYNIALFLGFFKYIGYLAFPIQMTYRYPALARFMAGHWATEAVHIIPVFGERGALLEHKIYSLFYNWPLTIRRRMQKRNQFRLTIQPRYWHMGACAIAGASIFAVVDAIYVNHLGNLPSLKSIWMVTAIVPSICGVIVTIGAGGAVIWKRIIGAALCGVAVAILSTVVALIVGHENPIGTSNILINGVWRVFVFTILSVLAALFTELKLPEPKTE